MTVMEKAATSSCDSSAVTSCAIGVERGVLERER